MIRIDVDSCIFDNGDGKSEGTVEINGYDANLELEIYAIIKTFERKCKEPFFNAVERVLEDANI